MPRLLIFVLGTTALAVVSRRSLARPRSQEVRTDPAFGRYALEIYKGLEIT